MLVFLSFYVTLSILLSISISSLASVQVSAPYVVAGSTKELYTRLLHRHMARLLLKISHGLVHAAQPATILRCPGSFPWGVVLSQIGSYMYHSTFSISTLITLVAGLATTITFVFALFIFRPICLLSSDSSGSIGYNSCGVHVYKNMS